MTSGSIFSTVKHPLKAGTFLHIIFLLNDLSKVVLPPDPNMAKSWQAVSIRSFQNLLLAPDNRCDLPSSNNHISFLLIFFSFLQYIFLFVSFLATPQHMEVPRSRIKSKLAIQLTVQLQQRRSLNPLCWARNRTHVLATSETPSIPLHHSGKFPPHS